MKQVIQLSEDQKTNQDLKTQEIAVRENCSAARCAVLFDATILPKKWAANGTQSMFQYEISRVKWQKTSDLVEQLESRLYDGCYTSAEFDDETNRKIRERMSARKEEYDFVAYGYDA